MDRPDPADPERRDGIRALWSSGSYAEVGDRWARVGTELADELDRSVGLAGRPVLDAACGTGNTALALARSGADVVGVDLTLELLAIARQRADAAGLAVTWCEGDLLDLPAEDDSVDVVTSTFGAFTADDPHRCAAELVRVTRPGGTIALTAWSRRGPFEVMRELLFERFPVLADMPRPDASAWAEPDGLGERFAGTGAELVDLVERSVGVPFTSVEEAVAFYGWASGPILATRAAVEGLGGDWREFEGRVADAWRPFAHEVDGGIDLRLSYTRALLQVP